MENNRLLFAIPEDVELAISEFNTERIKKGKKKIPKYIVLTAMIRVAARAANYKRTAEELFESGEAPNPRRLAKEKVK